MIKSFILGNPRSGTSLFRLMLHQHSFIVAPPECGFAHWLMSKYKDWSIEDSNSERINEFIQEVLNSKKMETWGLREEDVFVAIEHIKPKNYAELVSAVYMAYGDNLDEIKAIVDKNNYYINHLDDLLQIWPDAKFIHIIRDGRDVACSYKELKKINTESKYKPTLSDDVSIIAKEWQVNNNLILKYFENLDSSFYITIRYEDLIMNPSKELEKVCELLGVHFEEKMLHYYKAGDKKTEPLQTIDWKKKTLELPDVTRIGRYKFCLSNEEKLVFNQISGDLLNRFNYL